jgi:threonine dehydrogenase-like Zn-dependent dehydrogenase
MQRLKFFGNRQAAVEQAPTPAPPDDGVVIEVKATALCGTDLHSLYRKPEESPCTPGHEFAGTVAETGKNSRFRKGDRITIYCAPGCGQCWFCKVGAAIACPVDRTYIGFQRDGGDAEFAAVPDRACFILPDDISFEDGALIGDGVASIYHGLKKAGGVREGDTVGVFGVGPMGLGMTNLASFFGATVVAIDSNQYRLDLAQKLGAKHTINLTQVDVNKTIHELTDGKGLSLAIECAANPAATTAALENVGYWGKVLLIGEHDNAHVKPSSQVLSKELTITGTRYFHHGDYDDAIALMRKGFRPERMVTHRFNLSDGPEAFRLFDQGKTGKVVLTP